MRRWWLVLALLLSVGVNAGILATLAVSRRSAPPPPATGEEVAPVGTPAPAASVVGEPVPVPGPADTVAATPEAPPPPAKTPPAERPPGGEPSPPAPAAPPPGPAPPTADAADTPRAGREGAPQPLEPRLQRLADELGLAGERRTRFVALQRRMITGVVVAERRRRLLEAELRRQLVAPAPDEARIGELIRRQVDLLAEMEQATARTILESRRLLDPQQERRYLAVVAHLRPRLREEAARRWQQQDRPGPETRPQRPFRRPR